MANSTSSSVIKEITRRSDMMLALGVAGILALMILPMPPVMVDLLLAINITFSLIILMTGVYIQKPLDFSIFPTILLLSTLFRLSLNICSTRLILLHGKDGVEAAGSVIKTFGNFVISGNYVVGFIIFIILIVINFTVITKGSGRIAEVAARFTLDAMPGKQMSIDAELAAGALTEAQARKKRHEVEMQADFYGSMDGASKFVRGDAVAGLIITGINIVAGLIIGVLQGKMEISEAAAVYTILTVGDGLVSQIPALLISTAAGIVVTRASGSENLGSEFSSQMFGKPKVLMAVSGLVSLISFIPGMPTLVFLGLASILLLLAFKSKDGANAESDAAEGETAKEQQKRTPEEELQDLLAQDLLELEVGYGLIPLVDTKNGGELLLRIISLRKQFAKEMGIIVPLIHIRDNLQMPSGNYRLLIKGVEVGAGSIIADRMLAMSPDGNFSGIPGVKAKEPAFGLEALWIEKNNLQLAESYGCTVVDAVSVVITHLTELLRNHAYELLSRQEMQELLNIFAQKSPKVVEELIPHHLSLGETLRVFRNLLREKVPVRDMRTILETLADYAPANKDTTFLTEQVRKQMSKTITELFIAPDKQVYAAMIEPHVENALRSSLSKMDGEVVLAPDVAMAEEILKGVDRICNEFMVVDKAPLIMTAPDLRRPLADFVRRFFPQVAVVSSREISYNVAVMCPAKLAFDVKKINPSLNSNNFAKMNPLAA